MFTPLFCSGISDAQIRVLKAKLRIMQEELDEVTSEYYKKVLQHVTITFSAPAHQQRRTELQLSSHEPSGDGKRE